MKPNRVWGAAAGLATCACNAMAGPVMLDFEGIGDLDPIAGFYSDRGISFSAAAQALVDSDAGGSGDFANEPLPDTIMVLSVAPNAVMNHAGGFSGALAFSYTSTEVAVVHVYAGLDLGGAKLATLVLDPSNDDDCVGDPAGKFCGWTAVSLAFDGVAHSIDFRSPAGATGWDNVAFDALGVGVVPEPGTLALLGLGLAGLAGRRREARRS